MQKATVGGVLSIVASAIGILMGLLFLAYPLFMSSMFGSLEGEMSTYDTEFMDSFMAFMWVIFIAAFLFHLILGALGIAGGICAVKRKAWGLALAGAIASSMLFYYIGIVAVILVAMAQPEFVKQPAAGAAAPQA